MAVVVLVGNLEIVKVVIMAKQTSRLVGPYLVAQT
jgi:hypothetical protein